MPQAKTCNATDLSSEFTVAEVTYIKEEFMTSFVTGICLKALLLFWRIDWQGGCAPKDLSSFEFYFANRSTPNRRTIYHQSPWKWLKNPSFGWVALSCFTLTFWKHDFPPFCFFNLSLALCQGGKRLANLAWLRIFPAPVSTEALGLLLLMMGG